MIFWLIVLILCALTGETGAGFGDPGYQAGMPSRYREAPASRPETPATRVAAESDAMTAAARADYLNTITAQRAEAAEASDVVREFLLDANSLDQRKRTRMLQALATLHANAADAAALEPPPDLASLHAQHLESLEMLATAGALYTTGMDTHDPSQYDRASRVLAEGTEMFDAVGVEIDALTPPQSARSGDSGPPDDCGMRRSQ